MSSSAQQAAALDSEAADSSETGRRSRGRIPKTDWPVIVGRYRNGDTLAVIANDYGCTPSAISYVIRKAEQAGVEPAEEDTVDDQDTGPKTAPAAEAAPAQTPANEPAPRKADDKPAASPVKAAAESGLEPIDETEARLRKAARALLKHYRDWRGSSDQPVENRAKLGTALHDLRKVMARIDMDISIEASRENAQKPIPLPRHRNTGPVQTPRD